MTLTEILLTIPEYAPDHFQECADLLRHIEHGDAELYALKAARRIAGYLHNYSRAIPPDVRDEIMRSILELVPNRFAFIRSLSGMTQAAFSGHFGIP